MGSHGVGHDWSGLAAAADTADGMHGSPEDNLCAPGRAHLGQAKPCVVTLGKSTDSQCCFLLCKMEMVIVPNSQAFVRTFERIIQVKHSAQCLIHVTYFHLLPRNMDPELFPGTHTSEHFIPWTPQWPLSCCYKWITIYILTHHVHLKPTAEFLEISEV